MDKVNAFPPLTAPCPLIFLSNLSNTNEIALAANLGKTPLVKVATRSNNFLPKIPKVLARSPPN